MQYAQLVLSDFRGRIPTRGTCALCRQRFEISPWAAGTAGKAEADLRELFAHHCEDKHAAPPVRERLELQPQLC